MGLATGDTVQVVTRYRVNGQVNLMVLHYRVVTPDPTTSVGQDCQQIADWFSDDITSGRPMFAFKAILANNTMIDHVRVQRVWPVRSVFRQSDVGVAGGQTETCTAQNLAASVTKRTDLAGRKGIGRIQVGAIPQDVYTAGTIVSGPYKALFNALETALVGTSTVSAPLQITLCLPSSQANPQLDVTDIFVQPEVRTMHRRTVGLGI